jgi:hypothetical protein
VVNNTILQPVGDAVRLTYTNGALVTLENNIISVAVGFGINVDSSGQAGFLSDYNLFDIQTAGASLGKWGTTSQSSLTIWQTVTTQDSKSIVANPQFLDPDGSDNVLGYTTANGGYDGGKDDNFHLHKDSPAIDRAYPFSAPVTDLEGNPRSDDPGTPNQGPDYAETSLGASLFPSGGTAQNWRGNNTYYYLALPFVFPFYETNYTNLYVSSEGTLHFAGPTYPSSGNNTMAEFLSNRRIAVLWDNIRTNGTGDDIFVDTSVANQVTIRWNATNEADGTDVNAAVTLYKDGRIRFYYGAGNTSLTPTIGLSRGDGQNFVLSGYNGQPTLDNANAVEFALTPGFSSVDVGAYEFQGSSLDTNPPRVLLTDVHQHESLGRPYSEIHVLFSEPLDPIDANAPANYQLIGAGADGVVGNADDVVYPLVPHYTRGSTEVTLDIVVTGGVLPDAPYRFTVSGNTSIHDLAGLKLDGDGDGVEGGNFVALNIPPVLDPISDKTIDEDTLLSFTANAHDPDGVGQTLTFSLASGAPTGAAIDSHTGLFTWTPTEAQGAGQYIVTVLVADNGTPRFTDQQTFRIIVNEIDRAPVLLPIGNKNVDEGSLVNFTVTATDSDLPAQSLTYMVVGGLPSGATFDPATREFRWSPSELQGGADYPITFRVTESGPIGLFAEQTVTIRVNEINTAPIIAPIPHLTVTQGEVTRVIVSATDIDVPLQTLTYSLAPGAPADAVIDPASGKFSWTPSLTTSAGDYQLTVLVRDSGVPSAETQATFTITVIPQFTATLDVDGDGIAGPLTDGRLIFRYLSQFAGPQLIGGNVLGAGATRTTAAAITAYLDQAQAAVPNMLDVDGDGIAAPLTDGRLIFRYLSQFAGTQLTGGNVLGTGATRTTADAITAFLDQFLPPAPATAGSSTFSSGTTSTTATSASSSVVVTDSSSPTTMDLSLAYVQQSWVSDFVTSGAATANSTQDEELLIALPA